VYDNTIIIVSSDHGELLAEDGKSLGHPSKGYSDELLRTPLIMAGPGIPKNLRVAVATQNVDIMPTLASVLSLEHHARFDGVSLTGTFQKKPQPLHDFVYAKATNIFLNTDPMHIIIQDGVKYVAPGLFDKEDLKTESRVADEITSWSLPDYLYQRKKNTHTNPASIAQAAAYMHGRIAPLFQAYSDLSIVVPPVFQYTHWEAIVSESLTKDPSPTDNKWTIVLDGNPYTPSSTVFYVAYPESETAPVLSLLRVVPPGSYKLSIHCRTVAVNGVQRPASFRLNTTKKNDYKVFTLDPKSPTESAVEWIDVGTYTLYDKDFYYKIKPGLDDGVSVFGGLRFESLDHAQDMPDINIDIDADEEKLKALGYFN